MSDVPLIAYQHVGKSLTGLNRLSGYLFQAEALFPWKTALENVAIGLETAGTPKAQARERAQSWLARVGLSEFGARYPHMRSGGQRKRIGLVQVLIRDPKILLMDEPFGPLDAQTRLMMGNMLLELWAADRKAVIFITHDLPGLGIERAERLVHQQDFWIADQHLREPHPLALAARQHVRIAVGEGA